MRKGSQILGGPNSTASIPPFPRLVDFSCPAGFPGENNALEMAESFAARNVMERKAVTCKVGYSTLQNVAGSHE